MPITGFSDGDNPTAAQLNQIEDQLVVTCTSVTRPTGIEGRLIYETDTDRIMVYDAGWRPVSGSKWVDFTPTWSEVTLGTGATSQGRYRYTSGAIRVQARLVLGTGGAVTGQVELLIPNGEVARAFPVSLGGCVAAQGGTTEYVGVCRSRTESTDIACYGPVGDITINNPFTWGASDQLWVDIEVAI